MQVVKHRSLAAAKAYSEKVAEGFRPLPYYKPDYIRFDKENSISRNNKKKTKAKRLGVDESRRVHEMIIEINDKGDPEKMTKKEIDFVGDMACVNGGFYSVGQGEWVEKMWVKVFGEVEKS